MIFELAWDLRSSAAAMPVTHPRYRAVAALEAVVTREAERISCYPECGLQQILLGIAALKNPDPTLESEAKQLAETRWASGTLKVCSLVPEHRTPLVTRLPSEAGRPVENCCVTESSVLCRYKGGAWAEYSLDLQRQRTGITPAAYCSHIAQGGETLVLVSANTVTICNPWPHGTPWLWRGDAAISTVALASDGNTLALGSVDGSYRILACDNEPDGPPQLEGDAEGSVVAAWFTSSDVAFFVCDDGLLLRADRNESWGISSRLATQRGCRFACSAGGEAACLTTEEDLLYCVDGCARPRWRVQLSSCLHALSFCPGKHEDANRILCGLEDGTLLELDPRNGSSRNATRVGHVALQHVEGHPDGSSVLCVDSASGVYLVSTKSPPGGEFRSWPVCRQILSVHWHSEGQLLQAVTPEGQLHAIHRERDQQDWVVETTQPIEGPLDDAWMLADGRIVALHRVSDENQIWVHYCDGRARSSSRCLWRGNSFFNLGGPAYIHTMAVSRGGTYYAAAMNIVNGAVFRYGRLCRFLLGARWVARKNGIHELVVSDDGKVVVITRDRGSSAIRPPARLLVCGKHTHVLLEEGWAPGLEGVERGAAQKLFGTAVSREGRVVAAVDTDHRLWLFTYDPHRPECPPVLFAHVPGVSACNVSDSGMLCAALLCDHAIAIYHLEVGRVTRVAMVLPSSPPSYFQIDEAGPALVVAGPHFIQSVSFSLSGAERSSTNSEDEI